MTRLLDRLCVLALYISYISYMVYHIYLAVSPLEGPVLGASLGLLFQTSVNSFSPSCVWKRAFEDRCLNTPISKGSAESREYSVFRSISPKRRKLKGLSPPRDSGGAVSFFTHSL